MSREVDILNNKNSFRLECIVMLYNPDAFQQILF